MPTKTKKPATADPRAERINLRITKRAYTIVSKKARADGSTLLAALDELLGVKKGR